MSGKDEKPKPVIETDERIVCPGCGRTQWRQYQSYNSRLFIDLANDFVDEGDIEWYDTSEWECANCGHYAPDYILDKLERLH